MVLIDYVDLTTMRAYVNMDQYEQATINDSLLEDSITSASREVDERCDRYFGQDATVSARTFDCDGDGFLFVDDISTTTGLLLDGVALTTSHKLLPRNGVVAGSAGHPYTRIKSCSFTCGSSYEVTARWGWAAVPQVVVEATKMLAAETYYAKDVPLGIKGDVQFGVVRIRERIQIEKKLKLFARHPVDLA